MKLKTLLSLLIPSMILIACVSHTAGTPVSPAINLEVVPSSTFFVPTATFELLNTATATSTPQFEFEIVGIEILSNNDATYHDYIRPGVNVKVLLSNLDPGLLPEDQLIAKNFCSPCVGWDNAGMEDGYHVVILHIYSADLKPGENTISISAFGTKKQRIIVWEPPTQEASSANVKNPQGEFEIVEATALAKDDPKYKDVMRPGVNIKVLLSNLDPGLMPEDQLKPKSFCDPCVGWDNAGTENGYNVVVLHYYSSSLIAGENIISISAYGVTKEIIIQYDPALHLN